MLEHKSITDNDTDIRHGVRMFMQLICFADARYNVFTDIISGELLFFFRSEHLLHPSHYRIIIHTYTDLISDITVHSAE